MLSLIVRLVILYFCVFYIYMRVSVVFVCLLCIINYCVDKHCSFKISIKSYEARYESRKQRTENMSSDVSLEKWKRKKKRKWS